jgi:hypothetical protein
LIVNLPRHAVESLLTIPLDITIFSDVNARATAGNFLQVPILAGSNRDEGDLFLVLQQEATLGFTMPVLTEILANIQGQASLL